MQKILTLKAFYTNVKLQQTHLSWTIIISHAVLVFFYTPWKWSLMGYIGITLSIRPSVCEKFVSGPYFFLGGGQKNWKFLLHTKIAEDQRVCHDLHSGSFWQGQSHWQEKSKICVLYVSFLWRKIWSSYLTQKLLITLGWHWRKVIRARSEIGKVQHLCFFLWRNIRSYYFTQILLIV